MIKQRQSGIELLKLLAMFMIVISHVSATALSSSFNELFDTNVFGIASQALNISQIIILFTRCFGSFGNIIFVICSAYFLCDVNKRSGQKIVKILLDYWTISLLFLFIYVIVCSISGVKYNDDCITYSVFPVLMQSNWFVVCYLLLIIAHPLLNILLIHYDNNKLLIITGVFLFFYVVLKFFIDVTIYYNEFMMFCLLYILIGLLKRNYKALFSNTKIGWTLFLSGFVVTTVVFYYIDILPNLNHFNEDYLLHSNNTYNPFLIISSIGLLIIFLNIDFINNFINRVSSWTLFIYLIHENYIFRGQYRPLLLFNTCVIFSSLNKVLIILLLSVALYVASVIISWIYSLSFEKFTKKASSIIHNFLYRLWNNCPKFQKQ